MNRGLAIIVLAIAAVCLFMPSGFDPAAETANWVPAGHTPATAPFLDTFRAGNAGALRMSSQTPRDSLNVVVAVQPGAIPVFRTSALAGNSSRPFILRI